MAQAIIRARTDLDASGFNKGIAAMQASATRLKGFVAGAFSIGAVAAFAKSSIQYAAGLQDAADQFGITASEAEGFSRAITNVGGSTEKAMGILRALQAQQEKTGDTRTLSQYIDALRKSYQETGNFGDILEIVGSKNAAVFSAALDQMTGGLEEFNDLAKNQTVASIDRMTESLALAGDQARMSAAGFAYHWTRGLQSISSGVASLFSGQGFKKGMEDFYEQDEAAFQENETRKLRIAQQTMRRRYVENLLGQKPDAEILSGLGAGPGLYKMIPDKLAKPEKPFEVTQFDALRRIGANIVGGKSVSDLKSIYKTLEDSKRLLQETADNTETIARDGAGGIF